MTCDPARHSPSLGTAYFDGGDLIVETAPLEDQPAWSRTRPEHISPYPRRESIRLSRAITPPPRPRVRLHVGPARARDDSGDANRVRQPRPLRPLRQLPRTTMSPTTLAAQASTSTRPSWRAPSCRTSHRRQPCSPSAWTGPWPPPPGYDAVTGVGPSRTPTSPRSAGVPADLKQDQSSGCTPRVPGDSLGAGGRPARLGDRGTGCTALPLLPIQRRSEGYC